MTLAASKPGVFAGGDAAFPPGLLITAAAQGKLGARSIDAYLKGKPQGQARLHVTIEELPTDTYTMVPRYEQIAREVPIVPLARRSGITEVESRFVRRGGTDPSRAAASTVTSIRFTTARRCILCDRCVDICPEHCLHFTPG